ncbi:hypothetical protein SAMN02910413_1266 [Pseudobutyrivibrio sp. C4]|uniref:hypothetical protein n=1 Tax=Pseudobutyrivibrio sp. C4 TaxID=1520803 RepID=UPI0008D14661|nr:hypothetical protein [Pseudobutyrivibrio sp. C4]SES92225.1 hypothetical protein SAMN02910413_1266 [Pseudobutyrivibrio sp. C4]
MIKFEKARELAQSRKVLLDTVSEYDNAYVFSYSKGLKLTMSDEVVVLKDSGAVYLRNQIKEEQLGKLINTVSI